ncbi:Cysteine and glycine-rich protein 1 [Choanephora cucurbitarum]|uniref:Cysteine and glycine-rich protein 1 n=1 Tax=Choanephora cucurbitarum TaxID=101091 RepID=A0A1C7NP34_9FUNG|nr:Cysteine and glycine-rich protein 1 [Choanephora cucurbitarum]
MPPRFGGAPQCPRCQKSVYMAEQVIGPGGFWHKSCLTCKECNKRLDSTTLTEKDDEAYCKTCYSRQWGPKGYGFAGGAAFLSTENKLPSEIIKERINDGSITTMDQPTSREIPPTPPRPVAPPTPPRPVEPVTSRPPVPPKPDLRPAPPEKPTSLSNRTSYVPKKFNFTSQQDICTRCGKAVYAAELMYGAGNKYHKMCLKCTDCGKRLDSTNMVDRDFELYCRGCYSKSFGPKGFGYNNLLMPEGATR